MKMLNSNAKKAIAFLSTAAIFLTGISHGFPDPIQEVFDEVVAMKAEANSLWGCNPVRGGASVTSGFVIRGGRMHYGLDLSGGNRNIVAVQVGTVVRVRNNCSHIKGNSKNCSCNKGTGFGGFGNFVLIRHDNGFLSLYAHLQQNTIEVSEGQRVDKGRRLGTMGDTGHSRGVHLHFEVRRADNWPTTNYTNLQAFNPRDHINLNRHNNSGCCNSTPTAPITTPSICSSIGGRLVDPSQPFTITGATSTDPSVKKMVNVWCETHQRVYLEHPFTGATFTIPTSDLMNHRGCRFHLRYIHVRGNERRQSEDNRFFDIALPVTTPTVPSSISSQPVNPNHSFTVPGTTSEDPTVCKRFNAWCLDCGDFVADYHEYRFSSSNVTIPAHLLQAHQGHRIVVRYLNVRGNERRSSEDNRFFDIAGTSPTVIARGDPTVNISVNHIDANTSEVTFWGTYGFQDIASGGSTIATRQHDFNFVWSLRNLSTDWLLFSNNQVFNTGNTANNRQAYSRTITIRRGQHWRVAFVDSRGNWTVREFWT
jgi:murein DD-endopeptidase MepM/ murein hydrolase activator NlpD